VKRVRGSLLMLLLPLAGYGCAASAAMPAKSAPAPAVAVPAEAPAPAVVAVPAGPSSLVTEEPGGDREASPRASFAAAQQALEASTGSCTAACRALGSMDRATGRLCGLASSRDDARVCDDDKVKLRAARDRVRTACGSCPGGPTVDPSAPAPTP
jgi:hypothetical protein